MIDATFDALVVGDAVVDLIAEAAPLETADRFERYPGGSAHNVATALNRLGVEAGLHTSIPADPNGNWLADRIAASGLPRNPVVRTEHGSTTVTMSAADGEGSPDWQIFGGPGGRRLAPGMLPEDTVASADVVHLTGITLAAEPARTTTRRLAARAAAAGCTVTLDVNARPGLWREPADFRAALTPVLRNVDVVFASVQDLKATGLANDPIEGVRTLRERGPTTGIVTLGADGACMRTPSGETRHAGFADRVSPEHTAGAGDAFVAGWISARLADRPPEASLALGNAVAATATTGRGAVSAVTADRVEDLVPVP